MPVPMQLFCSGGNYTVSDASMVEVLVVLHLVNEQGVGCIIKRININTFLPNPVAGDISAGTVH